MVSVGTICEEIGAVTHVKGDSSRDVERVVVGDLLSFIMGSDGDGAVWVTIQTHLNVAAVAVLKEVPVIIIASGRLPAEDLKMRCEAENIALVTASESVFDVCLRLGELGLKG